MVITLGEGAVGQTFPKIHAFQIIPLYTLHFYDIIYQLYLKKSEKSKIK